VANLAAASPACQTAVGGGTLKNEARAWKWYTEYCNRIGLGHNPFLDRMSRHHKIKIMGAFAMALCQEQFSRAPDAPLAHSTVRDTLNLVAATFWDNGRDGPKQDAENKVAQLIRHQLRNENSNGSPHGSCTLLGYVLMRIPKSTKIGAAIDKATLFPQYRFHQRQKNPQSQLNQLELS
jgi:hypothetical protein